MQTDADKIKELQHLIARYEQDGAAKLFYSLNRKMNEMADTLNKSKLDELDLTDPKNKQFERLKIVWNEAASIATAVETLGRSAGVTGDEDADTSNPKYRITTPESMSDAIGTPAGQRN